MLEIYGEPLVYNSCQIRNPQKKVRHSENEQHTIGLYAVFICSQRERQDDRKFCEP